MPSEDYAREFMAAMRKDMNVERNERDPGRQGSGFLQAEARAL